MKINKGIIGLGLIFAIVLGIAVVGGGAYYLGKSDSKKEVINSENILPNIQNQENKIDQNQPVVENNKMDCTPTSPSSIKVLSPNGGETYTTDKKIAVKWSSCNISTKNVAIGYKNINTGKEDVQMIAPDNGDTELYPIETLGNYKIIICNTKLNPNSKFEVSYLNDCSVKDESDNSFTINSQTGAVSTTSDPVALAKDLIEAKWGGCKTPEDVCSFLDVSLSKNSDGNYKVIAVYNGMHDDSIQNEKNEGLLSKVKGSWVLSDVLNKTWSCRRGHSDYSKVSCI